MQLNNARSFFKNILIMSLFMITSIMAPLEAKSASLADAAGFAAVTGQACDQQKASPSAIAIDRKANRIAKIRMTKDCKYPVYDFGHR